jgi:3-hydroxyacyl-[acyl-carrier-protein] dehydratase
MISTALPIATDHPAYPGHFPGMPVLPGVVLLDATLGALERAGKGPSGFWEVSSAKFRSAVRPGEALTLHHETLPNGSVRFAIRTADRAVASGVLVPSQASMERNRGEQS